MTTIIKYIIIYSYKGWWIFINNLINDNEYLKIKSIATNHGNLKKGLYPMDKLVLAEKKGAELYSNNDEMKMIYINNFLITDEKEFVDMWKKSNKDINALSKELNLPMGIITSKLLEITKYSERIYRKKNAINTHSHKSYDKEEIMKLEKAYSILFRTLNELNNIGFSSDIGNNIVDNYIEYIKSVDPNIDLNNYNNEKNNSRSK